MKYKLNDGYEFDIKPAPIDDGAADLIAFVLDGKGGDPGLDWGRRGVHAILKVCAPEALKRCTLADVVSLSAQLGEMLNDAWGGKLVVKDAPKN